MQLWNDASAFGLDLPAGTSLLSEGGNKTTVSQLASPGLLHILVAWAGWYQGIRFLTPMDKHKQSPLNYLKKRGWVPSKEQSRKKAVKEFKNQTRETRGAVPYRVRLMLAARLQLLRFWYSSLLVCLGKRAVEDGPRAWAPGPWWVTKKNWFPVCVWLKPGVTIWILHQQMEDIIFF